MDSETLRRQVLFFQLESSNKLRKMRASIMCVFKFPYFLRGIA